ncbi:MAG: glycosyltransferase family 2 protein [Pseudomonadota bacterium]
MSILVFIPMYNCETQIVRVLRSFEDADIARFFDGIICIDNGSTDATRDAARASLPSVRIPVRALLRNDDNYGLGGSHKVAIDFARDAGFDHLVVLHGDDQGSIEDLLPRIEAGDHEKFDFLMGARFMKGSKLKGYSFVRTMANRVFNVIFSAISKKRLYDLGSGLNMFRVSAFNDGFHRKFSDDLTFNYYLILAVAARNASLKFFPLTWREEDQISNAKLGRMGFQLLRLLWRRIANQRRFFEEDHRATPRTAYPSTVIARWDP